MSLIEVKLTAPQQQWWDEQTERKLEQSIVMFSALTVKEMKKPKGRKYHTAMPEYVKRQRLEEGTQFCKYDDDEDEEDDDMDWDKPEALEKDRQINLSQRLKDRKEGRLCKNDFGLHTTDCKTLIEDPLLCPCHEICDNFVEKEGLCRHHLWDKYEYQAERNLELRRDNPDWLIEAEAYRFLNIGENCCTCDQSVFEQDGGPGVHYCFAGCCYGHCGLYCDCHY